MSFYPYNSSCNTGCPVAPPPSCAGPCPPLPLNPCCNPCDPVVPSDPPHVFYTGLIASTLGANILLPALTWTNLPAGATTFFVQNPVLTVPSIVTVNASATVEPGVTSSGIVQFRLLIDGVPQSVASFQSPAGESHIMNVALNWGGSWAAGAHTVALQYQNVELVGDPPFFNSVPPRSAGEGGSLTTFFLHFTPL